MAQNDQEPIKPTSHKDFITNLALNEISNEIDQAELTLQKYKNEVNRCDFRDINNAVSLLKEFLTGSSEKLIEIKEKFETQNEAILQKINEISTTNDSISDEMEDYMLKLKEISEILNSEKTI